MIKKRIENYNIKGGQLISESEIAKVIRLRDGSILKIFNPMMLCIMKLNGLNMEQKILDAQPIKNSPEILVPTATIYNKQGEFLGYSTNEARGVNYNTYDDNLTISQREDLHLYARDHSKLENVLRKNSSIVFPDFCTCDNMFFDKNGNVQFIDYDGLQVGKHRSLSVSTSLGDPEKILSSKKYHKGNGYFTKELDKKSSIILYFLTTFNANLDTVGKVNPLNGELITLEEFFKCINLDDPDLCHKTWKLFQDDVPNDFLGDTVYNIAEKYDMHLLGKVSTGYLKVLTKKR